MSSVMKALILGSACGILAVSEANEALDVVFNQNPTKNLAEEYLSIENGKYSQELKDFITGLTHKGYVFFEYENPAFSDLFRELEGLSGERIKDIGRIKILRKFVVEHLQSLNTNVDHQSYQNKAKILAEYMASKKVAERSTEHDLHVKESVETINELDRSINSFTSRLREWYGLHFPELTDKLLEDNHIFAKFVSKIGQRDEITVLKIKEQLELSEERATLFKEKADRSMGGEVDSHDIKMIQTLATRILNLIAYRKTMEDYISNLLEEVAPNLKTVLGSQIAAKMIEEAGSLEKLAKMSSSTIQLLGAEKALFKALRSGGNTPKYGVLFQWHKIRGAKPYLRGKIARMVSGKIGILAKVDYFDGDFIGDEYKEMIDEKIDYIKKTTSPDSGNSNHHKKHRSKSKHRKRPRKPRRRR